MHPFQGDFFNQPSNSDKLKYHGYHRIYPWYLSHFRTSQVNLLEIGLNRTESLRLWKNYFSNLNLYGIDIDEKKFDSENVSLFKVDQSDEEQLNEFIEKVPVDFTIIIDDGSHVPEHQILTLSLLWKKLIPGGVYIIEDIETSYWGKSIQYGYSFNAHRINVLKEIISGIEFVNFEFTNTQKRNKLNKHLLAPILKEAEIISFAYNCIILVKKDPASFGEFYREKYKRKYKIDNNSLIARFRKAVKHIIKKDK